MGIQLTQGKHKGRLLFIGHRGAYVQDSVWYSDDNGKTYSAADAVLEKMVRCFAFVNFATPSMPLLAR